jgi:23S rRNA pseudouridine2604 synthase
MTDDALRLAKQLALERGCSRREAELLIVGGWVSVDGVSVEEPQARVRAGQTITVDAGARPEPLPPATLVWHKPAGVAVPPDDTLPDPVALAWFAADTRSPSDRSGRRLLRALLHRLWPVSVLPVQASGLMVFTHNPGVGRRITDRQSPLEQEWLADVTDPPTEAEAREAVLRSIGKPLHLQGRELPRLKASWQSDRRLRLAFKHDLPAEPGWRLERAGLDARAHRQRIGRIGLDGMAPGQWRCLGPAERF